MFTAPTEKDLTFPLIMNYLTTNLSARLARNDPTATEVSVRRLPLTTISAEEITSIVEALQHNTAVKSVDLSIPASSIKTDYMAVNDNEIIPEQEETYSYLVDTLSNNTGIDTLTVRHVESDAAWTALSTGLQRNTSIQEISFGDTTSITATALTTTACEAVRDLLTKTKSIECISLKCFALERKPAMKALCTGIQLNRTMKKLVLQQIESEYLFLLVEALTKSKAPIEKLFIIDCDLDFEEGTGQYSSNRQVHPLTSLMSSTNLKKLRELRITECIVGTTEVAAVCEGMKYNTTVQLLDLTGCDLLADACKPIANMLATNQPLRHLIMQENIIGDYGASLLCQGLAVNCSLTTVDLKANHITGEGCDRLAAALQSSSCRLQSLNLSENDITDLGASALGSMLRENSHLCSLNLDACALSDLGIGALCQGLASNSALKELNLSNNWCKEGGNVANMLSTNTTLESLDLSSCHVSDETLPTMLRSLRDGSNATLKRLFLSFNAFGNAGAGHIADMIMGDSKLSVLGIQFNAFDWTGLRDIAAALAYNTYLQSLFFWNGSTSNDQDCQLLNELDHRLALNKAGRRAITECDVNKPIWADILGRANEVYGPSGLFCLLREIPELMDNATQEIC